MTRKRRSSATRTAPAPALRTGQAPFGARGALAACLAIACLLALAPVASSQAAGLKPSPAWLAVRRATSLRGASGSAWRSLARWRALSPGARHAGRLELATRAPAPAFRGADGAIDGQVTSSVANEALEGIEACAFEPAPPALEEEEGFFECTTTSATGEYMLEAPAGEYEVEFFSAQADLDYQTQFYKDAARLAAATRVRVSAGEATTEIDAALLPGGEISGDVTAATSKAPLTGVLVCASDEAIEVGNCAITGPGGAYTIVGLANGFYEVLFFPLEGEGETTYALEIYPSEVGVTVPDTTSGIDAALSEAAPSPRSAPAIVGSAVAGQTLTAVHASWTNHPTSIVDEWGRCSTVTIGSCFTIATGASYTLTASDVGHLIRIREKASNAAGVGELAFSPATAIVAPAPSVTSGPAPAAPAPPPAIGVRSSTSAKASVAQLRSLLERLLVPSGRNAKIAQLLKHKGYSVAFTALSAGKLTISWFLVPKGAHVASARPVLAAIGSVSSSAPGGAKLTIKLTAKGKGLLAHAGRLELTAKGLLQPSGAANVSATRSFTLER